MHQAPSSGWGGCGAAYHPAKAPAGHLPHGHGRCHKAPPPLLPPLRRPHLLLAPPPISLHPRAPAPTLRSCMSRFIILAHAVPPPEAAAPPAPASPWPAPSPLPPSAPPSASAAAAGASCCCAAACTQPARAGRGGLRSFASSRRWWCKARPSQTTIGHPSHHGYHIAWSMTADCATLWGLAVCVPCGTSYRGTGAPPAPTQPRLPLPELPRPGCAHPRPSPAHLRRLPLVLHLHGLKQPAVPQQQAAVPEGLHLRQRAVDARLDLHARCPPPGGCAATGGRPHGTAWCGRASINRVGQDWLMGMGRQQALRRTYGLRGVCTQAAPLSLPTASCSYGTPAMHTAGSLIFSATVNGPSCTPL